MIARRRPGLSMNWGSKFVLLTQVPVGWQFEIFRGEASPVAHSKRQFQLFRSTEGPSVEP